MTMEIVIGAVAIVVIAAVTAVAGARDRHALLAAFPAAGLLHDAVVGGTDHHAHETAAGIAAPAESRGDVLDALATGHPDAHGADLVADVVAAYARLTVVADAQDRPAASAQSQLGADLHAVAIETDVEPLRIDRSGEGASGEKDQGKQVSHHGGQHRANAVP